MIKCLLVFLIFATQSNAQPVLSFDKRHVESEDKWVAYQMDEDSSYIYGFIYIDEEAGLTFNYEGRFKIVQNNVFVPQKRIDSFNLKARLLPNDVRVAFIPASKFAELGIKDVPDWLKYYKETKDTLARLYKWGYLYNSWRECSHALEFLDKAYALNPDYHGIRVELGFAYNALKQYEKAISVLEEAIAKNAADCLVYKELVYALANLQQMERATNCYKKGVLLCNDKGQQGEMAFNIAYHYYLQKDYTNFSAWGNIVKGLDQKSIFSKYVLELAGKIDDQKK